MALLGGKMRLPSGREQVHRYNLGNGDTHLPVVLVGEYDIVFHEHPVFIEFDRFPVAEIYYDVETFDSEVLLELRFEALRLFFFLSLVHG